MAIVLVAQYRDFAQKLADDDLVMVPGEIGLGKTDWGQQRSIYLAALACKLPVWGIPSIQAVGGF